MVVGPCNTYDSPTRTVAIEETLKGGTCRSCSQCLNIGEPRVKVSYPNVIVQYAARIGVPSFFMHPECFSTYPVDFIRMGKSAYKETTRVANYVVNPERDIVGWDMFPQLHHYFSKCQVPCSEQQEPCQMPLSVPKVVVDRHHEELSGSSDALLAQSETDLKLTVNKFDNKQIAPVVVSTCLQKRPAADHPNKVVSSSKPPESDDNKNSLAGQMQINRASPKLSSVQHSESKHATCTQHSDSKPATCTCLCHSTSSEAVQWVTPREAAKTLGISPAFLRSLAMDRAIPVLRRPSGQRLYSIPDIRKFIDDNTVHVHPVSLKKQRLQ